MFRWWSTPATASTGTPRTELAHTFGIKRDAGTAQPAAGDGTAHLPLVAVTASTGWECYAIVEELAASRRFRVRALYRTPGTQAAARLEALHRRCAAESPGILELPLDQCIVSPAPGDEKLNFYSLYFTPFGGTDAGSGRQGR